MSEVEQLTFEFAQRPTIKGFPELRWTGKRPYKSTQYYPAQLRETYGEDQNGWMNKIFWGDNLQVMSHLLKDYRGKFQLVYIDPPFGSKADYKKSIKIRGLQITSDQSSFEEKQYGDIWTNDEYLQFMYERLILLKELMSDTSSVYVHCDWHKSAQLKLVLDEIFGPDNFMNEIIWQKIRVSKSQSDNFGNVHDTILCYKKSPSVIFNKQYKKHSEDRLKTHYNNFDEEKGQYYQLADFTQTGQGTAKDFGEHGVLEPPAGKHWIWSQEKITQGLKDNLIVFTSGGRPRVKRYLDLDKGTPMDDMWSDIFPVNSQADERTDYPTQKPETLIERIISAGSNPGDIVFDCFMGSGTTQAVAMKLGRRFIGADINLGAIQTTTKRLVSVANEINAQMQEETKYTGFEVYNVNNYDFFRNPVEARDLLIQALEIQPFPQSNVWDGELDGRMVKIMPVNRIATKADLKELLANLPYAAYEKRKEENPNQPVEHMTIVCMGHEPDLKGSLEQELSNYKVDVQILDVLRDKADLQLKRDSEAEIVREGTKLVIREFFPMNLMQKLSLQKEYVEEWRQLVDSVMIDWNYDGAVMQPRTIDIPEKNELVKGVYDIPEDAGTIKVKITDLLSESLEVEVR